MTRIDEETGRYRAELAALEAFGTAHALPPDLRAAMRGHLRLRHSAADTSDAAVLDALPAALRRAVAGRLYGAALAGDACWLLEGCPSSFLDALLAAGRVEDVPGRVDAARAGEPVGEVR